MDFVKTVKEVHPSLHGTNSENSTNISDSTLEGLTQAILKLKAEKKTRVLKVVPHSRTGLVTLCFCAVSFSNDLVNIFSCKRSWKSFTSYGI
jgi:hypothetical protein